MLERTRMAWPSFAFFLIKLKWDAPIDNWIILRSQQSYPTWWKHASHAHQINRSCPVQALRWDDKTVPWTSNMYQLSSLIVQLHAHWFHDFDLTLTEHDNMKCIVGTVCLTFTNYLLCSLLQSQLCPQSSWTHMNRKERNINSEDRNSLDFLCLLPTSKYVSRIAQVFTSQTQLKFEQMLPAWRMLTNTEKRRFVLVEKTKGTLSLLEEKMQMSRRDKNFMAFDFHGWEKKDLCRGTKRVVPARLQ